MKLSDFTQFGSPVKDLSRIKKLLEMLGNPQDKLKFVHIAGTNGKGSTLEFISNALIYSKYKVGQFTSPYNLVFEDRIRINNQNITTEEFNGYFYQIEKHLMCEEFSQFEVVLACSLLYFCEKKCDIVCLEAGIGGLLDATNIIQNVIVSVITSISLDHISILGDSLEKIALQKAGILKQNVPVVVANDNTDSIVKIIRNISKRTKSTIIIPNTEKFSLRMSGEHQQINAQNAKSAIAVLQKNGYNITESNFLKALSNVQVPARFEIISTNPLVICDGAHNYSAICRLVDEISKYDCKFTVIFGVINTKDYKLLIAEIEKIADKIILVSDFSENAVPADLLRGFFNTNCIITDCNNAVEKALGISNKIIISGSIYLRSKIDFNILNL